MRENGSGTSWQSKASMRNSTLFIAQRLQFEHLTAVCKFTKVVAANPRGDRGERLKRNDSSYLTTLGSANSTPAARLASTVAGTLSMERGISWLESLSRAYRVLAVSA